MSQPTEYTHTPEPPLSPSDQRLWATLIHVGGIFFGVLPSFIGYLVLKDRGDFVRYHTRSALNFQINVLIGVAICWILSFIVIGLFIAIPLELLVIVCSIIGAVDASKGVLYRYPLAVEFLK